MKQHNINENTNRKPGEKIRIGEKISYAMIILGGIPLMTVISSFLMIFYTNVVGLDPAKVATLFLIARICDGISDPLMGIAVDRLPRTKMGRVRPALIFGSIICGINYLLLWFGPAWIPAGKMVVVYLTYLLLGFTFDIMDIATGSLLPVMTSDQKERTSLSTIAGAVQMVGAIAISIAAPLIIGNVNEINGYYTLIGIVLLMVLIGPVLGTFGVRERVLPQSDQKYTVRELLNILKLQPVLVFFLYNLLYNIGSTLVATSNAYFFTYVTNNLDALAGVSGMSMVGLIPGILISGILTNKLGRKNIALIGMAIVAVSPLIRYIDVMNLTIMMISSAIGGIGIGFIMPSRIGINADNVDYIEYVTNQRAEGASASVSSFAVKCASGVGGALPGYVLALYGFEKAAAVQAPAVVNGIIFLNILLPVIFYAVTFIIFALFYPITRKKMAEITAQLTSRRG